MTAHIRNDAGEITDYFNAKGHKVPAGLMNPEDTLIDETVRDIFKHGEALMSQIARFRGHSYDDIGVLLALLGEKYGIVPRGLQENGGGNVSFKTFDGLKKVEISVQKYVVYGPQLQFAKQLVDEYINEVSEGAADEVRALLNHAFEVDKAGKVNSDALYTLRRLNITHPTWVKAMDAIKDSQHVESTRQFLRISERPSVNVGFKSLQINLANAEEVDDA